MASLQIERLLEMKEMASTVRLGETIKGDRDRLLTWGTNLVPDAQLPLRTQPLNVTLAALLVPTLTVDCHPDGTPHQKLWETCRRVGEWESGQVSVESLSTA